MLPYTIFPLGDNAITIELGNDISESINERVVVVAAYLQQQQIIGVTDIIPAYTTVTVVYDAYTICQKHRQPYQFIKEQIETAINFIFRHSEIGLQETKQSPNKKSHHYKNEITQAGIFKATQEKKSYQYPFVTILH